ncbi:pyocin knob domain-containing S74 family peptidase [Escherichia coli]
MPRLIFKNNFEVALAQPTTTSDTTITIRSGSGFPTLGANERVVATIVDAATGLQFEIVIVTAVVGNVLTVQRAQEGTAARAWAAGDMLSIRTTAATLTGTVRNFGIVPSGMNLNALTGTWFGQYFQDSNGSASSALNYPAQQAGVLEVLQTGVISESCIQRYTTFDSNNTYQRRFTMETQSWSSWVMIYSESTVIPVANGGTGQTTIQGMKTAFGFGTVADQNVVPTSMGGTGSGDNAQAWLNIRPQGSTPLSGDPVNDYDATTKRWVENLVNTGTVGPSMNGVMNYGVGDFQLRDSRAYIQPYEVVADGQLLNRADWPELWAYAQMLSPIADADWLADPAKRGKYSLGNGTTTFRVPDRNGVQTGSIQALFGRGDGGNSGDDGLIFAAAAPNIIGEIPSFYGFQAAAYDNASGALGMNGKSESTPMNQWNASHPGVSASFDINFRASRSSPVYGRNSITDNILPRNFVGVWVIRASGGFVAANTQWAVINGDTSAPPSGTNITGGRIDSKYRVNGADKYRTSLQLLGEYDVDLRSRITTINDDYSVGQATWDFFLNGRLVSNKSLLPISTGYAPKNSYFSAANTIAVPPSSGYAGIIGGGFMAETTGYKNYVSLGALVYPSSAATFPQAVISQCLDYNISTGNQPDENLIRNTTFVPGSYDITFGNNSGSVNYIFSKSPVSDIRLKKEVNSISTDIAIEKIRRMEYKSFIYNYDEKETLRRGFIAQELKEIDEQYVRVYKSAEGKETMAIDENVMLLDAVAAIQNLLNQVDELKEEIAALKAAK